MKVYIIKLCLLLLLSLPAWLAGYCAVVSYGGRTYKTPADSAKNIFIRVVSSKTNPYAGEPFIVKYQLCNSVSVIDPQTNIDLVFKNCYQEAYPADQHQATEKINGKTYNVVTLKQYLVMPYNAGNLLLPEVKIHIKVNEVAANDFFGGEKLVEKEFTSNASAIMVRNLPAKNDTLAFSGAVGKFKMTGSYQVSAKNPNLLLFHLTIDGVGNTKSLSPVNPKFPEGIDTYNSNTTRRDTLSPEGMKTHLEYSFQLVANYRGKFHLPPFAINYFDPAQNAYVSYASSAYNWQVNKGPAMVTVIKTAPKQAANMGIRMDLDDDHDLPFSYSVLFFISLGVGLVLFIYSYAAAGIAKLLNKYVEIKYQKLPKRRALKNIKQLLKAADGLNEDNFSKELTTILYRFLEEKNNGEGDFSALTFEGNLPAVDTRGHFYQSSIEFLASQHNVRFAMKKENLSDKQKSCEQLLMVIHTLDDVAHV